MTEAEGCDRPGGQRRVSRHGLQGVLGTVVDLRVETDEVSRAAGLEAFVVDELVRLEGVFSVFDHGSDLCRWRRGDLHRPGAEFSDLVGLVLVWQERSGGVFNPLVGELTELWRRAEERNVVPDPAELREVAASIAGPRFEMVDGLPIPTGDCSGLNLNAIAKGFIVDRVCEATVAAFGVDAISLNVGGDVRHLGRGSLSVGIENPLRPYDNEPPVAVIDLEDAALATSGSARRGFRVDGRWFSHVLDPRTGQPALGPASASVVAPDAMTADVVATVATVFEPAEAIEWLESVDDVVGLVIDREGRVLPTPSWRERFGPVRPG